MNVEIKALTVGKTNVNSYLIACENLAWLIDPGDDYTKIIKEFDLEISNLKGIINTHGHFDHIGAVAEIKEKFNIPFYLHSGDKRLVSQSNLYRRITGDLDITKTPSVDIYLDDLPFIEVQKEKIIIHHTPGHTAGSVCFEIDGNLFSGDLFFKNNVGRTDLPGGNKKLMLTSVNYIFEYFKGFRIYPGHGESFILDDVLENKLKLSI